MSRNVEVHDWRRPAGEPADLADVIVTIMSLAATSEPGLSKVSRPNFYKLFLKLKEEFPDSFPPMVFTRTGDYVYSKTLGDALERAMRLGVEVMNPRFYYLGVLKSDAIVNLKLIEQNTGPDFILRLRPLAQRLTEMERKQS